MTISGLTDVRTGKPAEIRYDVNFFSMDRCLNPIETTLTGSCGDGVNWTMDPNGLVTISGSGKMKSFSTENGQPWAEYRNQVKAVIVEDGVTNVGNCAFNGCKNLSRVDLSDTVTHIGASAFSGCDLLNHIMLPRKLVSIGAMAFGGASFAQIDLPESVTALERKAFYGCDHLKSITVPRGVTVIGEKAFG